MRVGAEPAAMRGSVNRTGEEGGALGAADLDRILETSEVYTKGVLWGLSPPPGMYKMAEPSLGEIPFFRPVCKEKIYFSFFKCVF